MTTLSLFWHLSSVVKSERLDASTKLIRSLEQFQAQCSPRATLIESSNSEDDSDNVEGSVKSSDLDALNSQDVSYSIRRLIRGLASPRESSRLGFAVALTELLSRINTVTCVQIVGLLMDGTNLQGSMTGQEERDVLFARLFGFTAVIQSGLLFRKGSLPTSGSSTPQISTLTSYETTLKELLNIGERKTWLRESAWWSITLAVGALRESEIPWKSEAVECTLRQLFVEHQDWSPEKIALVLKTQTFFPDKNWRQLLSPLFKSPDLLSSGNLQQLARILKESGVDDHESLRVPVAATGIWKPQLHFVWDDILDQLLPNPDTTSPPRGSFQEFFQVVVDESLFSSRASDQRKYWGFQVFRKVLLRVNACTMPLLFTRNFLRSWINHLSRKDRYLHKAAKQVAEEVQLFVQKHPQSGFALVLQLTGADGSQHFDKLTKTKIVEDVLSTTDVKGVNDYVDHLFSQANFPKGHHTSQEDIESMDARRLWIIDQFGSLIRTGRIPNDGQWVQSVLDWLIINGFFIVIKKTGRSPFRCLHSIPNPTFSENLRAACQSRLISCLADLQSQTTMLKSGEKLTENAATTSDGTSWVSRALNTIRVLKENDKHVSVLNPFEDEESSLYAKALRLVDQLENVSGSKEEAATGVQLLLSSIILLLHSNEGRKNEELIVALKACIEEVPRMFVECCKKEKRVKSSRESQITSDPVDTFVSTTIGLLEKSISFTRTISNQVFSLLSAHVKESSVNLIIAQLELSEPEGIAQIDDGEMNEVEAEDTESQDSNADSEDSVDSEGSQEDSELREKIEEAFAVNGIEAAGTDDEELMDDDQMMAIDQHLIAVFRSRVGNKASKDVNSYREITHFKSRVLDLVDIFLKNESHNCLALRFIAPLIDMAINRSKDECQLRDKAKGILRSRIHKAKEVPNQIEVLQAEALLTDIHTQARKLCSTDMLPMLSDCSLYVSKALLQSNTDRVVIQTYQQSLTDFFTRKNSSLNTGFFQDFISRCPALSWGLRLDLLNLADSSVNAYRRCQAYLLLESLVSQASSLVDMQAQEFLDFLKLLRKAILDIMAHAIDEKERQTFTAAQLKQILKLAVTGTRSSRRLNFAIVEVWQPLSWNQLAKRLGESPRYKQSHGLRNLCGQIANLSADEAVPAKKKEDSKRKVEDSKSDLTKSSKRQRLQSNASSN